MKLVPKSLAIGIVGTLAYYAAIWLLTSVDRGPGWPVYAVPNDLLDFLGEALLLPLIPGALPGFIVAGMLAKFGIIDLDVHLEGALLPCALSAPFVHSYFVYRWLKWRQQSIGFSPDEAARPESSAKGN